MVLLYVNLGFFSVIAKVSSMLRIRTITGASNALIYHNNNKLIYGKNVGFVNGHIQQIVNNNRRICLDGSGICSGKKIYNSIGVLSSKGWFVFPLFSLYTLQYLRDLFQIELLGSLRSSL